MELNSGRVKYSNKEMIFYICKAISMTALSSLTKVSITKCSHF